MKTLPLTVLFVLSILGLSAASARAGNIKLTWVAPEGVSPTGYIVSYNVADTSGDGTHEEVFTQDACITLTLPDGHLYAATVCATVGTTRGNSSNQIIFPSSATDAGISLEAPTNLRRGDLTVTLQFSPDLTMWSDVGYAVISNELSRAFVRLNVPAGTQDHFRTNLTRTP